MNILILGECKDGEISTNRQRILYSCRQINGQLSLTDILKMTKGIFKTHVYLVFYYYSSFDLLNSPVMIIFDFEFHTVMKAGGLAP